MSYFSTKIAQNKSMKKLKDIFCIFLFFLCFYFNFYLFSNYMININYTFSTLKFIKNVNNYENISINYTFLYNNKIFKFKANEFVNYENLSETQKNFYFNEDTRFEKLKAIQNFGLSKKEIVEYLCPEIIEIKKRLCKVIDISPEENYVQVQKNSCKLSYVFGNEGKFLNQDDFYEKLYDNLLRKNKSIQIEIKVDSYKDSNDIKNDFQEKSSFLTNFSTSSEARKNNIRVALESFDGLVLEQGEVLSFNAVTGIRNEQSGYMPAKIISNGTFVEGFGGGVCQVSTTLYNACLLAGLDILEVHNHSLPVSYVEPSFDAMVNSGSSDLVIRNNTDGKIIITTSSKNDYCKVKIFGKKNKYKITRYSEKTKIIPAENDIIDTDIKKYGDYDLEVGEEKRISYPKDGFCSSGFLKYFDENGVLIETIKVRENKYNATKGIILKREN